MVEGRNPATLPKLELIGVIRTAFGGVGLLREFLNALGPAHTITYISADYFSKP